MGLRPEGSNPCRGIRRYRRKGRERFLSDDEIRSLWAVLSGRAQRQLSQVAAVRLLLLTGCRKSEILTLRWSDYREGRLFLRDSKTGPRTVWLSQPARAILDGLPRASGWVFPANHADRLSRPAIGSPTVHKIAILSRKGGAGKTTLAVHLAAAAERSGQRSAILDLDQQASATAWSDLRADPRPEVHICQPHRIARTLAALDHCDLVIFDTAPHAEVGALAAARAADMVLIPCRPSWFDLQALDAVLDIVQIARAKPVAVLNAIPPRGRTPAEARTALTSWGIDVLAPTLGQRQAFVHALNAGLAVEEYEPRSKAAAEVRALHTALMQRLDGPRIAGAGG